MNGPELRDRNGIRWKYDEKGKLVPADSNVIVPGRGEGILLFIGLVLFGVTFFLLIERMVR